MNWTEGVIDVWTDEAGEWRKGTQNGITALDVCDLVGAQPDRHNVQLAQMAVNRVITKIEREGMVAYGTGGKPRVYVIAANELEERALAYEVMRYNIGRLTRFARATKSLPNLQKKAAALRNETEKQLALFDATAVTTA